MSHPVNRALTFAVLAAVIVASGFLLSACAHDGVQPEVRTVEVKVAVPVACVPAGVGQRPAYPDTDEALKAAPGPAERYQLMAAGRGLRDQRLKVVEPVIEVCRRAGSPPP